MKTPILLTTLTLLTSCGTTGIDTEGLTSDQKMELARAVIEATTVPGTDKRCYAGFCRTRERTVDIEGWSKWLELKKEIEAGRVAE